MSATRTCLVVWAGPCSLCFLGPALRSFRLLGELCGATSTLAQILSALVPRADFRDGIAECRRTASD